MPNENPTHEFIISCTSCAARLKVSKPGLVGQMLACPKCGTMLKVKRPTKRSLSPRTPVSNVKTNDSPVTGSGDSLVNSEVSGGLKTELTTGDFEEIEQLLKKNASLSDSPSPESSPKFRQSPGMAPYTKPIQLETATTSFPAGREKPKSELGPDLTARGGAAQPLLPDDQWIGGAAAKKRQRMIAVLIGAIGLILVLLTIVVALLNGSSSSSNNRFAQIGTNDQLEGGNADSLAPTNGNPANDSATDQTASGDDRATTGQEVFVEGDQAKRSLDGQAGSAGTLESESLPNDGVVNGDEPPSIGDEPPSIGDEPPSIGDQPPMIDDANGGPPPIRTDDSGSQAGDENIRTDLAGSAENSDEMRLPEFPDGRNSGQPKVRPSDFDATLGSLDRLSQLVDGSDLSIHQFKDLAALAREEQKFGIPNYLIERNTSTVDVAKQLSIDCESVNYEPTPLITVLQDFMLITGVPITLELDSVMALHETVNPKLNAELRNLDYSNALDRLLESASLLKRTDDSTGIMVMADKADEYIEATYPLPKFPLAEGEDWQAATEEFLTVVQSLIAADSWRLEQNPSRLFVTDSQVTVINRRIAQRQFQRLLGKLNAAIGLAGENGDPNQRQLWEEELATQSRRIEQKLNSPSGLEHRFAQPLLDVFDLLSDKTGMIYLGDWQALTPLGWGPLTKIPGTITGDTLRDFLREVTQSLGVTYLVVDDHTIVLTSFEEAAKRTDLEVYSLKKALKGRITEEQALNILKSLLSAELSQPNIRTYYDKRIQCLIVVAPQMVQRKIEAIILELAGY